MQDLLCRSSRSGLFRYATTIFITLLMVVWSCAPILCETDNAPQAGVDTKLPFSVALVHTPEFCKTLLVIYGADLPFGLGHFTCKDLEPALKNFFSRVTVVREVPAPGAGQFVLQPEFVGAYKGAIGANPQSVNVVLQWTLKDPSGNVVWTGTVVGVPKHPPGRNAISMGHTMQQVVRDVAQQSGPKISSAPEVRRFVQLLLAKSSMASGPHDAAVSEIFQAIRDRDSAKVDTLLKENSGLASVVDADAETPLHLVASSGLKDVAGQLLANHADVNAKDSNGATPLYDAVSAGHKDVVELLLAANADPDAKDFKGTAPLNKAADQGFADVVAMLLARHADVNTKDAAGETALHLAASAGRKDVAELLLANKAEINVKDNKDLTPLLVAVSHDHADVAALLLSSHADVEAKTKNGDTPLHLAVQNGSKDLAKLLLDSKADVNARNVRGDTPLYLAALKGDQDLVELVLANGADVNVMGHGQTPLYAAASQGRKMIVETLIAHKADVKIGSAGGTPLHEAARQGHADVAEVLLAHNAEVNGQDGSGATPLHYALAKGHQDVADLLRRRGGLDFAGWAWPGSELIGPPHKIVLLPAVDSREDTHAKVDVEVLRHEARKDLERKHYEVMEVDTPPAGERWAMSCSLLNTRGRGISSGAGISCSLKDQQTGLTQWTVVSYGARQSALSSPMSPEQAQQMGPLQAAAVQSMEQTTDILLAAMFPGSARKDAVERAVFTALQGIPALPKKKRTAKSGDRGDETAAK